MSTFDDLYKRALLAAGGYSGGLYMLRTDGGDFYFLPLSRNKKGSWNGLQVDTVAGKRLPRKPTIRNQFDLNSPWKRIDPKDAPNEVLERFAERAEEFAPASGSYTIWKTRKSLLGPTREFVGYSTSEENAKAEIAKMKEHVTSNVTFEYQKENK